MFDIIDGSLMIEKQHVSISKTFTYEEFVDSELYLIAAPLITNPPYRSYSIDIPILFDQKLFLIRLYFKYQRLERLHLYLYESDNTANWKEWSEKSEKNKFVIINELFMRSIGEPPYIYEWGNIDIQFDKRSGDTGVIITYK